MENSIQVLFSTAFILMALGINAVVYVIDLIVKWVFIKFGKEAGKNKTWKDLILPVMPVVLGGVLGHFYEGVIFGLVAGFLSGLVWRVVKSFIKSKI